MYPVLLIIRSAPFWNVKVLLTTTGLAFQKGQHDIRKVGMDQTKYSIFKLSFGKKCCNENVVAVSPVIFICIWKSEYFSLFLN